MVLAGNKKSLNGLDVLLNPLTRPSKGTINITSEDYKRFLFRSISETKKKEINIQTD